MPRKCDLTGRGPATGNKVSHANNKTRRKFMVNLQPVTLHSEVLGPLRLRIATGTLRTVTKVGGIDAFLRKTPEAKLSEDAARLKRRIAKIERRKSESGNGKKAPASS